MSDTMNTLMTRILAVIPTAAFDEDNDGQIVIYTGLREVDGAMVPCVEPLSERIAMATQRGTEAGEAARGARADDWAPLSGEWAGESIPELLGDLLDDHDADGNAQIEDAYEEAALAAFHSEDQLHPIDNGYVAMYNGKRAEIYAPTLFAAKQNAVAHFKAPRSKQHMVHVMLAEKGGVPVTHVAVD